MSLGDAMRQKFRQLKLPLMSRGEAPRGQRSGEASTAASGNERPGDPCQLLMELVVDEANIEQAYKRVKANKGAPGVDGMTVWELPKYLAKEGPRIFEELLSGTYQPAPVRLTEIAKSDGGVRKLGIPTVLDRLIQQAILQVIQPEIDATFSRSSYGYRPNISAHDAVLAAKALIQRGKSWVADVDLSAFFDRVNHDILMERMSRRISDKRLLGLIRRYLEAGLMANGVRMEREEGTPQGGPLSPLLANVLLDEVDKELEKRGLEFCRYADDCNVYVASERAAQDAMHLLRMLFAKLHLQVNESKSAVGRPWGRKFLGYSFYEARKGKIAPFTAVKSVEKMKAKVREITRRNAGRNIQTVVKKLRDYLRGWRQYFRLDTEKNLFRNLDAWIRQRLRVLELRQWKRGRTAFKRLRARGASPKTARIIASRCQRFWYITSQRIILEAMPDSYYTRLGVPTLAS
jgi:RNA-directed DNA polymerase